MSEIDSLHGISANVTNTAQVHNSLSANSRTDYSFSLMNRYSDAYIKARFIAWFGNVIKIISLALAVVLLVIGIFAFVTVSGFKPEYRPTFMGITVLSTFVCISTMLIFYLIGILISAVGQMLKASLDGAVNGSPFVNNDQKAKIMSL